MKLSFVLALALMTASNIAGACPDGQYNLCVGPSVPNLGIHPVCGCVPNSGTATNAVVTAVNPVPDTLNLLGAIVHGNVSQAYSSLGALVTAAACVPCSAALNIYATPQDKATIEGLIGRGWLVFVSDQPELLLVDAGGTTSSAVPLSPSPAAPIAAPAAPRGKKTYLVSGASCAIVHEKSSIAVAGWVAPPNLTDAATQTTAQFPSVDLRPGDVIKVASNDECKVTPSGDRHVKAVNITYQYPTVVPGAPTTMKYFLTGASS